MIARLRGELLEADGPRAVVEAGGVGYEVSLPDSVLVKMPPVGERVDLLIRQVFREDGVALFGFLEPFQRRLFDLLTEVKGCGPKVGLSLIGQLGEDAVASALASQDAKALTRASGVGPRLAERLCLELKEKIAEEQFERKVLSAATPSRKREVPADELTEALLALGYRRGEAEEAAGRAREEAESVEEQLKVALRTLQR